MHVDDAGNDSAALEVNDAGASRRRGSQRFLIANGMDAIAVDGDRLMRGHLRVHGEDLTIDENGVHGLLHRRWLRHFHSPFEYHGHHPY